MIRGVWPAIITPFTKEGKIDFKALETIIDKQIKIGVDGLVLLGTTAEVPSLTDVDRDAILKHATEYINKRVKVIIGAATNSTPTTLKKIEHAMNFNPDGLLVVTPYYNKPNPSGLIEHFKQAGQFKCPIILYHIPGRTGLKVPIPVFERLFAEAPMVKGVKESDYDFSHVTEMAVRFGDKIDYICGNDDVLPEFLALGSPAIITAAGNVVSPAFVKMFKEFHVGKTHQSFETFRKIYKVIQACYFETNPVCSKYILSKFGICEETARLPLGEISSENKKKIDDVLKNCDKSLIIS